MRVIRASVLFLSVMVTSGCVFYPTGSGYHYEEVHHYHDEAYYVPAPAKPPARTPLGYGGGCDDESREPWEDTPCEKAPATLIFEEDFEDGLDRWKLCAPWSQGMSWKVTDHGHQGRAAILNDEEDRIPGGARLGTSWIVTRQAIDLRQADQPRLRLRLKGGDGAAAVQFRLVWAVAGENYEEERPIGAPIAAQRDWKQVDVDLSALAESQGRLMVVAKVDEPDGAFEGPLVDSLAIYERRD